MRTALAAAFIAAFAAPAWAQDDFELADGLAGRGWFDLAQELLKKIEGSSSYTAEQRSEAKYGLAKMNARMAERESDPKEKRKLYDSAIAAIKEFSANNPKHARYGESLSEVAYLMQQKGKFLMGQGRTDPNAPKEAEEAYSQAENLFKDLIKALGERRVERPSDEKDTRGMQAYDEWDQKMMNAKYNYGVSLFAHAEVLKDRTDKGAQMKELLDQMVNFFEKDFMWEYERYLQAYDAFIYMGRGFQLLAESSDGAKADDFWKKCFNYIGKAKGLLSDKELRKMEDVREVAERAYFYEIKARLVYGDTRKGGMATKQYSEAARLAEELFKLLPKLDDDMSKLIRLEQGRAYFKAGKGEAGKTLLTAIARDPRNKETWIESLAIDILGEYAGETDVRLAIEAADNIFEKGPAFLYQAIGKYRRAITAIKKSEDQPLVAHCWFQIGLCYFYLDRYYESVAAFTKLEDSMIKNANASKAADGALRKLMALKKLKGITKDSADQAAYDDFLRWATGAYPKQIGSSGKREAAISSEDRARELAEGKKWSEAADKYREAADAWAGISSDTTDPFYEEALFTAGFDWYRRGDCLNRSGNAGDAAKITDAFGRALQSFANHLAYVDKLANKERTVIKNAVGSVMFSCRIYLHKTVNKPEKALEVSTDLEKRFPGADATFVMNIMSQRIDAKLDMGKMGEAEDDLKSLKSTYQKEGIGINNLSRALGLLAQAFEAAAAKLDREKDREIYDNYSVKAAAYYYDYFQINPPDPKKDADKLSVIADKLFMAAQARVEKARAQGKTDEGARTMFAQARDLYAQYRSSGVKLTDEVQLNLRMREARCYLENGQHDLAIEIYREITGADPAMAKGNWWEDLADCYVVQAKAMQQGKERNDTFKKADGIFYGLAGRLKEAQKINEHYWRLLYKHVDCMWETDYEQLRLFYDSMTKRGVAPAWDDGKHGYQAKFEDLRKKLEEKLPKEKK